MSHRTTVSPAGHGYLAACACGWRSSFPAFSEHIARRQVVAHYLAAGGSDDDDSRELAADPVDLDDDADPIADELDIHAPMFRRRLAQLCQLITPADLNGAELAAIIKVMLEATGRITAEQENVVALADRRQPVGGRK